MENTIWDEIFFRCETYIPMRYPYFFWDFGEFFCKIWRIPSGITASNPPNWGLKQEKLGFNHQT